MGFTVTLGGTDRSQMAQCDTLNISYRINERTQASLEFEDAAQAWAPIDGQEITIQQDGTTIFGGIVTQLSKVGMPGFYVRWRLELADYAFYLDRHVIGAKVFESMTLHDIVAEMWTYTTEPDQALANEGITINAVETGPTIDRLVVKHESICSVLNRLCELAGFSWYVDASKDLHVFDNNTNAAPFEANAATMRQPEITTNIGTRYRNRQFVRGPVTVVNERVQTFTGDGVTQSFFCSFPLAETPTVAVNGSPQTVGVFGVDTGMQWYWLEGTTVIHQEFTDPPLTGTDTLSVTYRDFGQNVAMVDDDAEIAARALVEGGSGVYEDVLDVQNVDDLAGLEAIATATLRKYGTPQKTYSYETTSANVANLNALRAGQTQVWDCFEQTSILIESVDFSDWNGALLRARVSGTDLGEARSTWPAYFKGGGDSSFNLEAPISSEPVTIAYA